MAQSKPALMPEVFEALDIFPDRDNPLVQRLLDTAAHGGDESEHLLQRKRAKADMDVAQLEAGARAARSSTTAPAPPAELEPEPEPDAGKVGDLLGLVEPQPAPAIAPPAHEPVILKGTVEGVVGSPPTNDMTDAQVGGQVRTDFQILYASLYTNAAP